MLIQLTTEQVNEAWEALKPAVKDSLPNRVAENTTATTNILTSALVGDCTFWGLYSKDEKGNELETGKLKGVVVTAVDREPVTKFKRLLVFSFWANNTSSRGEIVKGIETLEEYAEGENCAMIYALTENPQLESMLETFGWNTNETLVYKPIK